MISCFLYIYQLNFFFIFFCGGIKSTSHAGYSYSGRAAAFAFGNIEPSNMWVYFCQMHLLICLNKFDINHLLTKLWGVFSFAFLFSSRVFLLGPSHHYYTPRCALSQATVYSTPVGDLPIDVEGIWFLRSRFNFITRYTPD